MFLLIVIILFIPSNQPPLDIKSFLILHLMQRVSSEMIRTVKQEMRVSWLLRLDRCVGGARLVLCALRLLSHALAQISLPFRATSRHLVLLNSHSILAADQLPCLYCTNLLAFELTTTQSDGEPSNLVTLGTDRQVHWISNTSYHEK